MSCVYHCKTPLHNAIRNGLLTQFIDLFTTCKLISSPADVEKEPKKVIDLLPRSRPFDLAVTFNHLLEETAWRTPLYKLGFDVVTIPSKPRLKPKTIAAQSIKEIKLRLRDGEKAKFQRRGKTDRETNVTLSGDGMIGEVLNLNMALLPVAIGPHGSCGSLFERLLYGVDALPSPQFALEEFQPR